MVFLLVGFFFFFLKDVGDDLTNAEKCDIRLNDGVSKGRKRKVMRKGERERGGF